MNDLNPSAVLTELVVKRLGELQMETLQRQADNILLSRALDAEQRRAAEPKPPGESDA